MRAWGKDQILDYTADIEVYMDRLDPPRWVARERRGHVNQAFESMRAEDTMRLVMEGFVTQLKPWEAFTHEAFGRIAKLGPKLVKTKPTERKAG